MVSATSSTLVYLIAIPLFSSAFLLLGGRALDRIGHLIGTAASAGSFAVALIELNKMLGRDEEARGVTQHLFTWINVGSFKVDATSVSYTHLTLPTKRIV